MLVLWAARRGLPPLLAYFGVSVIERTILDALARAKGVNLSTLQTIANIEGGNTSPSLTRRRRYSVDCRIGSSNPRSQAAAKG